MFMLYVRKDYALRLLRLCFVFAHSNAVGQYHHEAEKRQDERSVDDRKRSKHRSNVYDARLQRWHYRASKDGHNQTSRPEFCTIAKSLALGFYASFP